MRWNPAVERQPRILVWRQMSLLLWSPYLTSSSLLPVCKWTSLFRHRRTSEMKQKSWLQTEFCFLSECTQLVLKYLSTSEFSFLVSRFTHSFILDSEWLLLGYSLIASGVSFGRPGVGCPRKWEFSFFPRSVFSLLRWYEVEVQNQVRNASKSYNGVWRQIFNKVSILRCKRQNNYRCNINGISKSKHRLLQSIRQKPFSRNAT